MAWQCRPRIAHRNDGRAKLGLLICLPPRLLGQIPGHATTVFLLVLLVRQVPEAMDKLLRSENRNTYVAMFDCNSHEGISPPATGNSLHF